MWRSRDRETMSSYQIELRETRLATDGTDDVALFDVEREDDGETWIVPALVSPLFRVINMRATASADDRREMVAGLGARAIVDRLKGDAGLPLDEILVFGLDFPGAPGDPNPLLSFERVSIELE